MTTILGLDPATATGWAILHLDGPDETVTASGVYRYTKLASPAELRACSLYDLRLRGAYFWLQGLLATYEPDRLAIETPFYRLNAKTLVTLAQIGAVLRLAATRRGIPIDEIPPAQRCTALGLAGNASKAQVLATVNALYSLSLTDHNEADAVAIAAAGALQWRQKEMLK